MPSPNDNPIPRFKAAWWGLAILLLFAVLAWVVRIGFPPPPPTLEDLAAADRYTTRAEVDAAQDANLMWKEIEPGKTVQAPPAEVFGLVANELLAGKPVTVDPDAPETQVAPDAEPVPEAPAPDAEPAPEAPAPDTPPSEDASPANTPPDLVRKGVDHGKSHGGSPRSAGVPPVQVVPASRRHPNLRPSAAVPAVWRRSSRFEPAIRWGKRERNTGGTPALETTRSPHQT